MDTGHDVAEIAGVDNGGVSRRGILCHTCRQSWPRLQRGIVEGLFVGSGYHGDIVL